MNKHFLLPFFILFFAYSCYAQSIPDEGESYLETPVDELVESFITSNKPIKAIKAKEYQVYPSGAKRDNGTGELFEFDSKGHLVKQVEIEKNDTSLVRELHYTQTGFLNWQIYYDKEWNKRYKSGYRQNKDSTLFQVKSYEMLNEDASMLLDTRQYTYTESGEFKTITSLENGAVIETRHFTYDDQNRLVKEQVVDANEKEMLSVAYEYDQEDRLKNVKRIDHEKAGVVEEFKLSYNDAGELKGTNWLVNDLIKGQVTYAYDEEGKLSKIEKDLQGEMGQQQIVKVFEYQFYEN